MPEPDLAREKLFKAEIEFLNRVLPLAGKEALGIAARGPEVTIKGDSSPVTDADKAIDLLLKEALDQAFPEDGYLSEEREDDGSRLSRPRYWVIDPIDGTRGFMAGGDDWCISVGLVEAGKPILGAIYKPKQNEMLLGLRGAGVTRDGEPLGPLQKRESLEVNAGPSPEQVSRFGFAAGKMAELERFRCRSLALKLCAVALGKVDLAISDRRCKIWDIAAAILILEELGGITAPSFNELYTAGAEVDIPTFLAVSNSSLEAFFPDDN